MINIQPDGLIIKHGRGHARDWFVQSGMNNLRASVDFRVPDDFKTDDGVVLMSYIRKIYNQGRQSPTGFHKRGRQITTDKVYVGGIDTVSYPQIDWWLSYGGV